METTYTDDAASIRDQIVLELSTMPPEKLQRVLNCVQLVNGTFQGEPGWKFIQHGQRLNISPEDVDEMQKAIEEENIYYGSNQ